MRESLQRSNRRVTVGAYGVIAPPFLSKGKPVIAPADIVDSCDIASCYLSPVVMPAGWAEPGSWAGCWAGAGSWVGAWAAGAAGCGWAAGI